MGGSGNLPVGPGIFGFIAFFVLAVALWFLVRNMNGRLRRMAYRDRDDADQLNPNEASTDDATDGRPTDDRPTDGRSTDGRSTGGRSTGAGPDGPAPRP